MPLRTNLCFFPISPDYHGRILAKERIKKNRKVLVIEEAWKAISSPLNGGIHQVSV
jgi:hypothetical protein